MQQHASSLRGPPKRLPSLLPESQRQLPQPDAKQGAVLSCLPLCSSTEEAACRHMSLQMGAIVHASQCTCSRKVPSVISKSAPSLGCRAALLAPFAVHACMQDITFGSTLNVCTG